MSDESDYYDSDSTQSDSENENEKVVSKKIVIHNAAKPFGSYEEDESEIDDSEPDDSDADDAEEDEEQTGGIKEYDEEEVEMKENEEEPDEEDEDIEINEEGVAVEKNTAQSKTIKPKKTTQLIIANDDDDDDDEYEENYLQKFDNQLNKNYINEFHPECLNHNSDEVEKLSKVIRDENNIIIDPLHRTIPYLTKYEKARILGQRAKQIETGAKPFIKVNDSIVDGYIIAELELKEKKLPFIIKRPIPGGMFEYWHLNDLENINF